MSLSPTLIRNEKVEHYIKIKTHKRIALRFWVESGVNVLCSWAQVSLVFVLPSETPYINPLSWAIFTCLNDGGKYKDGCIEWFKLSLVEEQDERLVVCEEVASSRICYTKAKFYV